MYLLLMKGQFREEFVTAGGVPLSEVLSFFSLPLCPPCLLWKYNSLFLVSVKVSLNTMESKIHSRLFFAGEA